MAQTLTQEDLDAILATILGSLAAGLTVGPIMGSDVAFNGAVTADSISGVGTVGTVTALSNNSITAAALATDAVAEIAAGLLDLANGIETGLTPRGAARLALAALAGKLSGGGTTTEIMQNAVADSKARITATVDSSGNRTAITWDAT